MIRRLCLQRRRRQRRKIDTKFNNIFIYVDHNFNCIYEFANKQKRLFAATIHLSQNGSLRLALPVRSHFDWVRSRCRCRCMPTSNAVLFHANLSICVVENGVFLYFPLSFILSSVVPCQVKKSLLRLHLQQWRALLLPDGDFQFHIIFASQIWWEWVVLWVWSQSQQSAAAFERSWCAGARVTSNQIHKHILHFLWSIFIETFAQANGRR